VRGGGGGVSTTVERGGWGGDGGPGGVWCQGTSCPRCRRLKGIAEGGGLGVVGSEAKKGIARIAPLRLVPRVGGRGWWRCGWGEVVGERGWFHVEGRQLFRGMNFGRCGV